MSDSPPAQSTTSLPVRAPEFDWTEGSVRFAGSRGSADDRAWSLVVCGDWAPTVEQQTAARTSLENFYGDLLPILRNTDLAVVNLEGVVSDKPHQAIAKDGDLIQIPSAAITSLSAVPFRLACLANNHIFDFGADGLGETLKHLQAHNLRAIGAELDGSGRIHAPAIFQFGNTRVAIVNVAEGEEASSKNCGRGGANPLDAPGLQTQLTELRTAGAVVIVIVHAGREYLPVPAPHIRKIFRALVDSGANLVVGHHPHVPQGIEIHNRAPIVYSLGNFAFFLDTPVAYRHLGYLLRAKFCGAELDELQIVPYHIQPDKLETLGGAARRNFFNGLAGLSAIISDDVRLNEAWNAYADQWLTQQTPEELIASVALMSGEARVLSGLLQASVARFEQRSGLNRVARSVIWRAIRWLEEQKHSAPSAARAQRGAAILRNRFDTLSHRELYLTALQRVMRGEAGHASDWAIQALAEWQVFW